MHPHPHSINENQHILPFTTTTTSLHLPHVSVDPSEKKKKLKPPSSVLGFPQLAFKVNPPEDHVEKSSTLRKKKLLILYIYTKMEYIPLVNINV